MKQRCMCKADQPRCVCHPKSMDRWLGDIDRNQHLLVALLHFPVHHQDGKGSGANHTLDRGADKYVAQKLPSMGAHDNQFSARRCCRAQYPGKWRASHDDGIALNLQKLRHHRLSAQPIFASLPPAPSPEALAADRHPRHERGRAGRQTLAPASQPGARPGSNGLRNRWLREFACRSPAERATARRAIQRATYKEPSHTNAPDAARYRLTWLLIQTVKVHSGPDGCESVRATRPIGDGAPSQLYGASWRSSQVNIMAEWPVFKPASRNEALLQMHRIRLRDCWCSPASSRRRGAQS